MVGGPTKRQRLRKANFTPEEKEILVDAYERNFKIFKLKIDPNEPETEKANARLKKREMLEDLARKLTCLGAAERTAVDVRQKIVDYEKAAKEYELQRPSRSNKPRELSPVAERFHRIMKMHGEPMEINPSTRRRPAPLSGEDFQDFVDDESDLDTSRSPSSIERLSVNPLSAFIPLMKSQKTEPLDLGAAFPTGFGTAATVASLAMPEASAAVAAIPNMDWAACLFGANSGVLPQTQAEGVQAMNASPAAADEPSTSSRVTNSETSSSGEAPADTLNNSDPVVQARLRLIEEEREALKVITQKRLRVQELKEQYWLMRIQSLKDPTSAINRSGFL